MNHLFQAYKDMWTRTLEFKGRSNNAEYWWPILINIIVTLFFLYIIPLPEIVMIYQIAILLPCISLAIRRLHDANKSGWNVLWLYIPTALLIVYAGAILYYTQSPEIVDTFLKWFTVMVVGYVVFLVYSIYLLTHYTYQKKNHYGDVPHNEQIVKQNDEIILEAPKGATAEGTMTFKTKAFLEKAKRMKTKDETVTNNDVLTDKKGTSDQSQKEIPDIEIKKIKKKAAILKDDTIIDSKDEAAKEIIVKAQLKPTAKKPIKKVKTQDSAIKKEEDIQSQREEPSVVVKTIAQKRAETQQSSTMPKTNIAEQLKPQKETKVIHKPIKRKLIQPVEVPNMNVESIRTHSLDSIAKLVEQNMSKDPNTAPTVVANMKKQPVKRKKKDDKE